jgi:hypothetical protein
LPERSYKAAGPGTGARVTIQVQIFDEELGEIDEVKMTLQVSEAGQKQLEVRVGTPEHFVT